MPQVSRPIPENSAHSPGAHARKPGRLKHFVGDGVGATVCEGFAEGNFNAFATTLSASGTQLGALASLQNLASCWLQLWSEELVHRLGSRKRLVVACISLQCAILFGMGVATLLGCGVFTLLALILIFTALGALAGPVWSCWVSELLPSKRLGLCFGIRNQRVYPANLISVLVAGYLLQNLHRSLGGDSRAAHFAFAVILAIALVAKLISLKHLSRQPDVPLPAKLPRPRGRLWLVRAGLKDPSFRRTVAFFATMNFAVQLSGPFQTPYLLHSLGLSFHQFGWLTAAFVGARFLAAPVAGRLVDKMGSRRVLQISSILLPWISLAWCFSNSFSALLVIHFVSGLIWTAFDLCAFTFLSETTSPAKRHRAFAFRQVIGGLAAAAGASLGALLLSTLGSETVVFAASFVGRAVAFALVLRLPSEYPKDEQVTPASITAQAA